MQHHVVFLDISLRLAVGRKHRPRPVFLVHLHPMRLLLTAELRFVCRPRPSAYYAVTLLLGRIYRLRPVVGIAYDIASPSRCVYIIMVHGRRVFPRHTVKLSNATCHSLSFRRIRKGMMWQKIRYLVSVYA